MNLQAQQRGSVLIIVLWIAFGLVSVALYFAQGMSFELRSADNRVASAEAEEAIAGATLYVSNLLATVLEPGTLPDPMSYSREQVPVGESHFWLLGREDQPTSTGQPFFCLIDEASKLNVNTATIEMLEYLPRMMPEQAAAIIDWRDADSDVSEGGAEDEIYERLNPPYRCKNAPFESMDELFLVYGIDLEMLFGEDANLNGLLDANENDGDITLPQDNRNGRLEPGLLEYVTVFTHEPNLRTNGSARVNLRTDSSGLTSLLQEKLGTNRANQITQQLGGRTASIRSTLEFYTRSGMTPDEFSQIETEVTVATTNSIAGLINVNSASETVLACVPGIGPEMASAVVAYRISHATTTPTLAWVSDVIGITNAVQAGPYLTSRTYQVRADIVALGHQNRGYKRIQFIFDVSSGTPTIIYRQDLTHLGWTLGQAYRRTLQQAQQNRR
jgi:DNA uptake protein ComE-like DNA-binding protein